MKKLNIKESIEVETSAAVSWEIIGPNFLTITEWARGILESYENESAEKTFAEAPAGGRYCEVKGFGKMDERIVHYDNEKMEIMWSAKGEKLPGFLSGLQNSISVEQIDENRSLLTTNITADLNGFKGKLLGGVISKAFTKQIQGFLRDWKTYAETGEISETKKREFKAA